MSNIITVKRAAVKRIKRDSRGAVIRISHHAADVLEALLDQADGRLTIMELAFNLIDYAANDTIIKWEDRDGDEE